MARSKSYSTSLGKSLLLGIFVVLAVSGFVVVQSMQNGNFDIRGRAVYSCVTLNNPCDGGLTCCSGGFCNNEGAHSYCRAYFVPTPTPACAYTGQPCDGGLRCCDYNSFCNNEGAHSYCRQKCIQSGGSVVVPPGCCGGLIPVQLAPLTQAVCLSGVSGLSCNTSRGWLGKCTKSSGCSGYLTNKNIAWDRTVIPCKSVSGYGCCAKR